MGLTKERMLMGFVVVQAVVILFLIHKTISLRNENPSLRTAGEYFKKAYEEISDEGDASIRSLLDERESLLRELSVTKEVAREYGIKLAGSRP
ncbi:hypothetical protein [Candidatus Manganitrophus noduliformans]|uniref:Uncharacterized protein n=1 Tax=Candidatus Manganitrophus noduliformans TaxID=2606439 RepID=A0A7X6DU98_9BACT|nr:hypothetical protein [Candidatus Manganitrophus noduliformans]NKE73513.1 hypothetical protein [Candidatus Manganitrophus noduliformans]